MPPPRIETAALEQALGQQQRHGGIVGPGPPPKIERPTAEQVAHGSETARFPKLRMRRECVADRQAQQGSLEALT